MDNTFDYLKEIIRTYLNDDKLSIRNINIKDLYDLSNSLNVSSIVGYTLKNNNNYQNIFDKSLYKSMNRYTLFSNYKNIISKLFSKNNIRYIYLKGSTLSCYYKEEYLRYSSDLDIVVYKEDFDKALDLIVNDLSFSIKHRSLNEISLNNNKGVDVDLHKQFELDNPAVEDVFKDCFKDNELDINYKYIYLINHEAKHFILGQLSMRFFIDLFYLRKLIDRNLVDNVLDKLNLIKFDNALNHYLDYLLKDIEPNDIDLLLDDYILSYANDFGVNNRVNLSSNKFSYIINRSFPSFKEMSGVFPYLNKYPFLLPWSYLTRIFKTLICKRRKYVFNELSSKNDHKMSVLIDNLGISSYNKSDI